MTARPENKTSDVLRGWLLESQVYSTGHGAPMEPAIGIDADCPAGEGFEITWLVDGLE